MKFFKNLLASLAIATALCATNVYASAIDDVIKRGTLRVGFSTFKPWAFVNKQGKFVGFEIDVAQKLADDLGVKLELVPTAWDGIIPALNAGKFDLLIGGMSVQVQRNLSVNFSNPYGGNELIVIAHKTLKDVALADLNSRTYKASARRGSLPAILTKSRYNKVRLFQFDDDGVAAQEVVNGKADFTVTTSVEALMRLEEYPDSLVMVEGGKPISITPSAIAMRRGDVDTLNVVNNWIILRQTDGWLQKRNHYWFKTRHWKDM